MTTSLNPRPVYTKTRTSKKKTMTEQPTTNETLTKVQSHLADIQLIDRNALWEDFTNRCKINNYEVGEVMKDLKRVVKASQPHVEKLVNKVKDLRSK